MRRVIKYWCLIIILLIGGACSKEKDQNNVGDGAVKMAAINICEDTDNADILLLCDDGSYILCDAENEKGYGVVYMNESIDNDFENGLSVFLDENGIPTMASTSEGHFIFKNINENSFDLAFINNENEISYFNNVKFDYLSRSPLMTRGIIDIIAPWIDSWKSLRYNGWDENNKKAIVPFICMLFQFGITAVSAVRGDPASIIGLAHTTAYEFYNSSYYKSDWWDKIFYGTGMTSLSISSFDLKQFLNSNGNEITFTYESSRKFGLALFAERLSKYWHSELEKMGKYEEWVDPVLLNPEEWEIKLSPDFVEFSPDEDRLFVDVSSKASWAIDTSHIDRDWCKVIKLDEQVAVYVKANTNEYDRTCEMKIFATTTNLIAPVTLTIKQSGIIFELSPDKLTFTQEGGSKPVAITTNENIKSWDVTSYPSWCKIEKSDNSFWVTVDKNEKDDKDGIITVTAKTKSGMPVDRTLTVEQIYLLCPDDKHPHMIDLGLPSGKKWACCNIGASKPEDIGNRYAWGETSTKTSFSWDNYIYWSDLNGDKSVQDNEIKDIGDDISGTSYDAASANWGGSWRMPTHDEFWEMINNTKSRLIMTDKQGYYFKGNNGNAIFLPCGRDVYEYWTSIIATPSIYYPYIGNTAGKCLGFKPDWIYDSWEGRYTGLAIRAITN